MTRELKDLMDRATDRPSPHMPDVDHLLAEGNRSVRKRQLMATLATAVAVAVVAGGTTFALNNSNQSAPEPAKSPTQAPVVKRSTICEPPQRPSSGPPQATDADRWPEVVVSAQDPDGTVSVRRSADGRDLAFCATALVVEGSQGFFSSGGAYWDEELTPAYKIHRFDAPGCGKERRLNCHFTTFSFAGKLPKGITRVNAAGGGKTAEASIKDGFYACRLSLPGTLGKQVRIRVSMYDSAGKLVKVL